MSEDTNGLTVLSIDGASMHQSGVMPPLLILQEIAARYEDDKKSRPGSFRASKTFQMIGGVGDGGLLALMLGQFGMGMNDVIREYRNFLKATHQHSDAAGWSKDERSQKFESVLKTFVASKTNPSDEYYPLIKPKEENPRCKVFVTAMHALNLQHPILLRNYRSRTDADPPKCTLVEAIRATTAMPDLFTPVTLGQPHRQIDYFSPACHGFNNPIDQVRQEAKAAFPGHSISCIISLGCGHPGPVQIKDAKEDAARAVVQLAMDSVRAAEQTYRRLVGIPNLYFRFDVPYGLERAVLKFNPTLSEIRAHITAYVGQEQTSDRIDSAVKQLIERPASIEASELDGILPVEDTAKVWVKKCPLPSPNFTGRRDELDHMHAYFSSGVGSTSHIYIIYGLGGSGKSQLLFQFVLECQTQSPRIFDFVYFIDASLETTLETDLKAIAIHHKIGESAADTVQWLSCQTNRWLLVLDNADDKNFSVQKYIPKSIHGSVIITSRNPELAGLTSKDSGSKRIEDLEKWAAETLLKKLVGSRGTPSDDEDSLVTQVVEMLHCFALAVTQAGSYMCATGRRYQEYIELFEVERSRLLRERKGHVPDNYPWSVYTTWAISFDQLKAAPRHFMQICSYLHYTGIPKDLFMRAAEAEPLEDVDEGPQIWLSEFMNHVRNSEGRWNALSFDEIIQNVMSFSLLDYDSEQRLLSYHPLVHEWTREAIQFAYGQDFPDVQCALQLVALSTPSTNDNSSASVLLKRLLLPHLDSLVPGAVRISSIPIALCLSPVYDQAGRWNDCADIFERAEEIGGSGMGWNLDTCTINLAAAYTHLGRHADALNLELSVVANRKRTLGDKHPDTLTSMNNLATSYIHLGRHADALDLQVSVLANRKQSLGDEHPDTLSSMGNLATLYTRLGRHADALDLRVSVLANQRRALGEEHPVTLMSMNNLAMSYFHLERHAEALDLELSVLANRKRILGDEHPDTLTSMNNLAMLYLDLGRHAEALELQVSVLANLKRTLGDEHPHTLSSMDNLASMYEKLGRHADALDLHLSVLANRKRILGDEHPDTITSMNNLASTYQDLGRHAEATDLLIPAVGLALRVLGAEHHITSILQHRLEHNLVIDSGEQVDDTFHEELDTMAATIEQYEQEGRWEEAIEHGEIAVDAFSAVLGEFHPKTFMQVLNLAKNCSQLGRMDDGLRHIERAYWLINNDKFPSAARLQIMPGFEEMYSRLGLSTYLTKPREKPDPTKTESLMGETSRLRTDDERPSQSRAADAAEARRALDVQLKDMTAVKDGTTSSSSTSATEAKKSPNVSAEVVVTDLATAKRTNKTVANAPETSKESIRKGKARDRSSIPNDQNEPAAPVGRNPRATGPSVDQPTVEVSSSTLKNEHDIVTNEVRNLTPSRTDSQEPDVSVTSDFAVVSTNSTLLPAETKVPTEGREIAHSHMSVPGLRSIPSENRSHELSMAKMELKKLKVEADLEKLKIQVKAKSEKQQRQCRLEMARIILFALVILGIQWRDMKKPRDD
ncbi:hypothetical protein DL96DRAFT_1815829 [Flagelloscypha sp. PMI_526]|nr:hypothetical protein DL96DRAFT_1815829 [Flagelloscypha sp. PMI_526]